MNLPLLDKTVCEIRIKGPYLVEKPNGNRSRFDLEIDCNGNDTTLGWTFESSVDDPKDGLKMLIKKLPSILGELVNHSQNSRNN